ncbi:TPA: hypothetical protein DD394_05215 [bacterium UBP9_UBA11836]|nr:hypothetical protein [bacterium UBP9_UBA11836]
MSNDSGFNHHSLENDELSGSNFSNDAHDTNQSVEIDYEFSLKSLLAVLAFKIIYALLFCIICALIWPFVSEHKNAEDSFNFIFVLNLINPISWAVGAIIPCPFSFAKQYHLIFSPNGISGTVAGWFDGDVELKQVAFRKPYRRNQFNPCLFPEFILTEVADTEYVSWENFHSFTCHKDCIMLWREAEPPIKNKSAQWAVQTGFSLNDATAPLRVCCNNIDELRNLRTFLAERLPEVHTNYAGLKVIF